MWIQVANRVVRLTKTLDVGYNVPVTGFVPHRNCAFAVHHIGSYAKELSGNAVMKFRNPLQRSGDIGVVLVHYRSEKL